MIRPKHYATRRVELVAMPGGLAEWRAEATLYDEAGLIAIEQRWRRRLATREQANAWVLDALGMMAVGHQIDITYLPPKAAKR